MAALNAEHWVKAAGEVQGKNGPPSSIFCQSEYSKPRLHRHNSSETATACTTVPECTAPPSRYWTSMSASYRPHRASRRTIRNGRGSRGCHSGLLAWDLSVRRPSQPIHPDRAARSCYRHQANLAGRPPARGSRIFGRSTDTHRAASARCSM